MEKRLGEPVTKGETLFEIYANDPGKITEAKKLLDEAVTISDRYDGKHQLVYAEIDMDTADEQ